MTIDDLRKIVRVLDALEVEQFTFERGQSTFQIEYMINIGGVQMIVQKDLKYEKGHHIIWIN